VHIYELTQWGRELEPLLLRLGRWGSRRPAPDGTLGIDSLLLAVKSGVDSARAAALRGVYALHIDSDTYVAEVDGDAVQIRRDATPARTDATLTTDSDTLRGVCGHLITLAAAVEAGRLRLDGDQDATRRLTDLVLTPFTPGPR
jgi:hypothetical protein